MKASGSRRRPDYRPELRDQAKAAVAKHGSIRAAAEAMGLSAKRVWELVNDDDGRKK
jgi:hypothetical protein